VNGDRCQSESDPATLFLGDPEDVSRYDGEAAQDKCAEMSPPNSGYVTKEAAASSDDGSVSGASNLQLGNE